MKIQIPFLFYTPFKPDNNGWVELWLAITTCTFFFFFEKQQQHLMHDLSISMSTQNKKKRIHGLRQSVSKSMPLHWTENSFSASSAPPKELKESGPQMSEEMIRVQSRNASREQQSLFSLSFCRIGWMTYSGLSTWAHFSYLAVCSSGQIISERKPALLRRTLTIAMITGVATSASLTCFEW